MFDNPTRVITVLGISFVAAWFLAVAANQIITQPEPLVPVVPEQNLDAEATAAIIRRGSEIMAMAVKSFKEKPSAPMAQTLYQMTEEFGDIVEPECGKPDEMTNKELLSECVVAVALVVESYNLLLAYAGNE